MIVLGTRPLEGQDHFFNDLLAGEADYVQAHLCVKDVDPDFQKRSWMKACPSLKEGMPSLLSEIQAEARRAKKNPAQLAGFRALRLNMGTSVLSIATTSLMQVYGKQPSQLLLSVQVRISLA